MTAYLAVTFVMHLLSAIGVGAMLVEQIDDLQREEKISPLYVASCALHGTCAVWALLLLLMKE